MWWKRYPKPSQLPTQPPDPHQEPQLHPGDRVHLLGKPERIRQVYAVQWHRYRHQYVYIVENSSGFDAYWFVDQLIVVQ